MWNQEHFDKWLYINRNILNSEFTKAGTNKEIDFDFEKQAVEVYIACQGNNLKHMGNFSTYFSDGQYISAQANFKKEKQ
tara:strand:- start:591 stop:827 length:237 start_codon:yes stop_codon:yes gene_type:complete